MTWHCVAPMSTATGTCGFTAVLEEIWFQNKQIAHSESSDKRIKWAADCIKWSEARSVFRSSLGELAATLNLIWAAS